MQPSKQGLEITSTKGAKMALDSLIRTTKPLEDIMSIDDILSPDMREALKERIQSRMKADKLEQQEFSTPVNVWDLTFPPKSNEGTEGGFKTLDGSVAECLLVCNNGSNRFIKLDKVIAAAVLILSGNFKNKSSEGIVFTWDQQIANGQHRICSIYVASLIDPNVSVTVRTLFNEDPKNMEIIDIHAPRTQTDLLVMKLKALGDFERVAIVQKDIMSVIAYVPTCKGRTLAEKQVFARDNLEKINRMLDVLRSPKGGIRFNAAWAAAFVDASMYFPEPVIARLAKRFANNEWNRYENPDQIDPLHSLFTALASNLNANKNNKLTPKSILSMAIFAIRKALLEKSMLERKGKRSYPKYAFFVQEEADDYALHGAKSRVLERWAVAAKASKKKSNNDSDGDDE